MRFIPATHMGVGDVCVQANVNGGVSGSFTSGSQTWMYHEFTSSLRTQNTNFSFELISGYSQDARVILVAGGGGGGNTGTGGTYNAGGGGGAGEVQVFNNVNLFTGVLYTVRVGRGGEAPEPDHPSTPTYTGGVGGDSRFFVGGSGFDYTATGGEGGHGNASPYLDSDGGDSGNGYAGGNDAGTSVGGGGAGSTQNGHNAVSLGSEGGDGGNGQTIILPYTSPTFGSSNIGVGGGGGGGTALSNTEGIGFFGGGRGSSNANTAENADRYTGGGGGGGDAVAGVSELGAYGGDGLVIIMYPTGSCS